jgi:hypothetical protein
VVGPEIIVPLSGMAFVLTLVLGIPIVRVYTKRIEREGSVRPSFPPEVAARMERMEQAIESIAIEVERISEGQRFLTKVLADRGRESAARPGRVLSAEAFR